MGNRVPMKGSKAATWQDQISFQMGLVVMLIPWRMDWKKEVIPADSS